MKSKKIFIDFDSTICPKGYCELPPFPGCAETINKMVELGHSVTIFSCRGNKECVHDVEKEIEEMKEYLTFYGIRYTDIYFGKPFYDVLIDDRADGFTNDWDIIRKRVLGE